MKNAGILLCFILTAAVGRAQKIDSIFFHLYTDSLKKGFYNYINVDGKTADGQWVPLSANELSFVVTDSNLRFQNNDLFVDSAYNRETVTVKAILKSNPAVWKATTIYIRKRGFDEPLMTNEQAVREYSKPKKKKS